MLVYAERFVIEQAPLEGQKGYQEEGRRSLLSQG